MRIGDLEIGTEIFPYNSAEGEMGHPQGVTLGGEIDDSDILDRPSLPDPKTGELTEFLRLPLPENPSLFDSYLVRTVDILD